MKIWYQTATSYRYEPLWEDYGRTLKEQCQRAARPDTEVYVTGVPAVEYAVERYKYAMYYHQSQFLNNMLRAEKEGFDAYVSGTSYDPALAEGREMLDIPVMSIGHANLHMAVMLGERFAIITCQPGHAERYRQLVREYGLQQKHLPGPYFFHIQESEMAGSLKEPEPVARKFKEVARRAVAEGALVLIPVPAIISQLFYRAEGVTTLDSATVLDPVAVVIKLTEMMVDLKKIGIEVSRTLQVYGSPGKELLKKAFQTYSPVFRIEY